MNRHIGLIGILAMVFATVACGTSDTAARMKANTATTQADTSKTDTPKDQASGPDPGQGHEMMEKGMKMDGKEHPKEGAPVGTSQM